MEDFRFNHFQIQFGEDIDSDLNRILNESIISFSLSNIEFKIGVVDKKLQPFSILNDLIRVKKINLYLKVQDITGDVVGTFKMEDCNFLKIEKSHRFLNNFTYDTELKHDYLSKRVSVSIDIEKISFEDLVLYKKESKSLMDFETLTNEIEFPKKKSSDMHYDDIRLGFIEERDPTHYEQVFDARPMREMREMPEGNIAAGG